MATAKNTLASKINGSTVQAVALMDDAKAKIDAKLAAARKEVKAMRAERDAEAAARAAAQAKLDELAAAKLATPDHREEVQSRLASALDDMMAEFAAPSWKRVLASACLAIIVTACAGWCIGVLVNYLVAAALVLTGSAFLGWCIVLIGAVMSFVTGMVVGSKAFAYVASGAIDAHASAVKSSITGWFKSKPVTVFSGAHPMGAA